MTYADMLLALFNTCSVELLVAKVHNIRLVTQQQSIHYYVKKNEYMYASISVAMFLRETHN